MQRSYGAKRGEQVFYASKNAGKISGVDAADMAGPEWDELDRLFGEWIKEERQEPEHAEDRVMGAVTRFFDKITGFIAPRLAKDAADPSGKAASVLFMSPAGKVLLLKRSPTDDYRAGEWGLPGGKADGEETAEDCAARETREEVGDCALDDMSPLHAQKTPMGWDHTTFLVRAKDEFSPRLSEEHTEHQWFAPDEMPEPRHPALDDLVAKARAKMAEDAEQQRDNSGKFASASHHISMGAKQRVSPRAEAYGVQPRKLLIRGAMAAHETARTAHEGYRLNRFKKSEEANAKSDGLGVSSGRAKDEFPETKEEHEGHLPTSTRTEIGRVNSKQRESLPESDFLLPDKKKYPVKKDGKYDRDLLLAAARRARMHGRTDLARRADEIRGREFPRAKDAGTAHDPSNGQFTSSGGTVTLKSGHIATRGPVSSQGEKKYTVKEPTFFGKKGVHPSIHSITHGPSGEVINHNSEQQYKGKTSVTEYPLDKSERLFSTMHNSLRAAESKDKIPGGDTALVLAADRAPGRIHLILDSRQVGGVAFDKETVRKVDHDGRLRVSVANISKAAVNPYLGSEIPEWENLSLDPKKVYRLYRDPEEISKAVDTANSIPILDEHKPSTAEDHPTDLVIGSTGSDATFDAPFLRNSLVFYTKDAIDDIENDDRRQLSASYRYDADMTPGVTPEGEVYDGVMRALRFNHIALVEDGRCGPSVMVGDSALPRKQFIRPGFRWSDLSWMRV